MTRGTHGEKIVAAIRSDKMPERLKEALDKYDKWIERLNTDDSETLDSFIEMMVGLLNEYKFYIDVNLIFDSPEDFLYRQKFGIYRLRNCD